MIKNANWITPSFDTGDGAAEFIRKFTIDKKAVSASLIVTAIGVYDVYLNGNRIGDFILAPGCTAYNKRLQYQTYGISDMLCEDNEIVITVGKGWHRSRMSENRPEINTKPCAVIAAIEIIYEDGIKEVIRTDEKWYSRQSKVVFNDIWDGETYDATLGDFAETMVNTVDLDKDILIPQEGEIVSEQETLYPKELIITPKDEKVIDFGQEITGYVEFKVNAKKGDKIELSCAEILDKDGNFYNANYRSAKSKMTYICREGEQTYKPRFTFYGFRYIRLDSYAGQIDPTKIRAIAVYSDMKRSGYIRTSNKKLNKLFSNTLWSQRDNFLDIPTDCPQRDERMGWLGDAQVFAKTACYNYNVKKFFEKWLADIRTEQFENGKVPVIVPNFWKTQSLSTAWSEAIAIIPWQMYMMYGDKSFLADNFDAIKKWVDFVGKDTLDEFLWTCNDSEKKMNGKHCGDWLGLDAPAGSFRGSSDDDIIASAFYANCTNILVKIGKLIGKDISEYEVLYKNIKEKFANRYTDRLKTQTEHIMALYFNLSSDMKKTAGELNKMIIENGYRLTTGFVGTPYILHALSENGYTDTAYRLLLQEEYPSWLYEVNNGATTIWEHWDGIRSDGTLWSRDMNSYNHYAYGSVIDWIYSVAGGIRPDEKYPGFEKAVIAPKPSDRIDWIDVSLDTAHGTIRSKWEHFDKGIRYDIETPVKTEIIIDGKITTVEKGSYVFYSV